MSKLNELTISAAKTNWQNNLALTARPIGAAPKLPPLSGPDFVDSGKPFVNDELPIGIPRTTDKTTKSVCGVELRRPINAVSNEGQ